MASTNCSVICVVLFLCTMSYSTKAKRTILGASDMYANEMNKNRKLFAPYQRCRRGRITVELNQTAVVFNQTHEGKP
ncbi:RALF-like protein [Medicago truncatula]|uniref:RALF-like protein n=1 Tax=Medicago truncatula TaxID=3880 RepID=A0A072UK55_MEDTR|nr:RALF-like protein [Medicago truncatula]